MKIGQKNSFIRGFKTYYSYSPNININPINNINIKNNTNNNNTFRTKNNNQTKFKVRVQLMNAPSFVGHATSRVNRRTNEDRYTAGILTLPNNNNSNKNIFFYSVFDGHGGSECSEFLAKNLSNYIENVDMTSLEKLEDDYFLSVGGYWKRWQGTLNKIKYKIDSFDDIDYRIPLAYLTADYDYTIKKNGKAGSTCTSIFLYPYTGNTINNKFNNETPYWGNTISNMVVAHIGDTRAIICDKNGIAHPLTHNHHPVSNKEAERLQKYSANFLIDSFGEERYGNLAVTRAFGDKFMKKLGVSAEPDVYHYLIGNKQKLKEDSLLNQKTNLKKLHSYGEEAFIVLVTDGVTSVTTDQEIIDIICNVHDHKGSSKGTPQLAAEEIVHYVEAVGGDDNATCMVIRLNGWGKWNRKGDLTGKEREQKLHNPARRQY